MEILIPFIIVLALWWLLIGGLAFAYRGRRWFHLLVVWSFVTTVAAGVILYGDVAGTPVGNF